MLQYILECIAFQLVFLIIYDLFLKRESFFQWNRLYLIGTYIISMVLPWVKIEAMKTTVPETFQVYPEFLWNTNNAVMVANLAEEPSFHISWEYSLLFGGMLLSALFFGYKLYQIYALRRKGEVQYFKDFTRIIIANSSMAFSFFKSIFLGDKVIERDHENILQHELVHIRQRHSYDLMFFEFMRIVGWFNPLVYVYQSRVSELHEFIADAHVAKTHKKEQYQLLLSEIFQTQHISFINQFFKSSLIKKRIVMLTKEKSKKIHQLKYLLLLPLVFGMLAYTSSVFQEMETINQETYSEDAELIAKIENEIEEQITKEGTLPKVYFDFMNEINRNENQILSKENYFKKQLLQGQYFKTIMVEFGDDVEPKPTFEVPLPSTRRYENYVNREKTFQILDKNLRISINQRELAIRKIEKEDKNLGPGEFVYIKNIEDLTGDEIRKVNQLIDSIDFDTRMLFISDDKHAFLISKIRSSEENSADEGKELIVQESDPVPFATVDEVPVFPGCEDVSNKRACFNEKMQRHIAKNFKYPKEAQEKGIQGSVSVLFIITKKGKIEGLRMRGPDSLLEKEVARILGKLPKMKPGKQKGKKVDVPFSIPIEFRLDKKDIYETLPLNNYGQNDKIANTTRQYNQLISERKRLLKSTNEANPIIVNLDEHLSKLKESLGVSMDNWSPSVNDKTVDQLAKEEARMLYNKLISERKRLLKSSNEKNPIIVNLDRQIAQLRMKAFEGGETEQTNYENDVNVPFAVVDQVPIFPGCEDAENKRLCFNEMMQKHISKNFNYPEVAQEKGIQGRVATMFTISKDGSIENLRMRGPDSLLENEVSRIIKRLPKMIPGKQSDKPVNVPFSIPITFKLQIDDKASLKTNTSNSKEADPIVIINGKESTFEKLRAIITNDIESMNVIKDDAAIKKYGDKGKKGVIEVTLKKKD